MSRYVIATTEIIRLAVAGKHPISIYYKDDKHPRHVLPHAFGPSVKNGKHTISGYQSAGPSHTKASQGSEGWRLFEQRHITRVAVLDKDTFTLRDGFVRGDKRFRSMIAEV